MGLFSFLKKKEPVFPVATEKKDAEPYLGDLEKTALLFELVQVPHNERDKQWQQTFLDNIAAASFRCGDPQVLTGPDGFPYFSLFLPEPGTPFQCYVINRMKDDFLLRSGWGVAINPTAQRPDWVLSYGDILNLHLNNTFYTTAETPFSKATGDETLTEEEEVLVAQPSETLLPTQTRYLIAEFFKANGVKTPKIALMARRKRNGEGISQDLVFNVTAHDFTDENTYRGVMQAVRWYLPRHYSYVSMDEQTFGNGFMPL